MKALWTVGVAAAIVSLLGDSAHARQLEPAGRSAAPAKGAFRQQSSEPLVLLPESDDDKDKTPKPKKTPEPTKTPKAKKTPSPAPTPTNVSPYS